MIHRSLQVKWNLFMIALYAAAVLICLLVSQHSKWPGFILGSTLGLISGIFQVRAVQAETQLFVEAKTAQDVRAAFSASKPGNVAIASIWGGFLIILIHAVFFEREPPRLAPAYSAFLLVRECFALKACRLIERFAKIRGENAA